MQSHNDFLRKNLIREKTFWGWKISSPERTFFKLGISLLLGILFGSLIVFSPYLPIPNVFQKLILVFPFAFTIVILFNNLERLVLFVLAIGVPLNLDFSVIISPLARNPQNIANGRTIVALTELRVSLILVVVVIGYILWLVGRQGANRLPVRFFASISIPALGLILISILSVIQAQDKQLAFFKIMQLIELFLIYFYVINHIRTKQDLQFFLIILLLAMFAENLLIITQWLTGLSFSFGGVNAFYNKIFGRPGGTLGPAGIAGGINAALLVILLAMLQFFPKRIHKVFFVICFIVGCIALIISSSRAAWVSFIVAIFGFIFIGRLRGWISRKSMISFLLLTLVIGLSFYPIISNRLIADDRGSASSRPKMFRLAWNVIQASPSNFFFGVGANNYALIAPSYNTSDVGNLGYIIDSSVHNAYLLAWAETGLLGLLIFISFIAAPLVKTWQSLKTGNRIHSIIALSLGCALIALSIQMLVDPYIMRAFNIILWLVISLIASMDNLISRQTKTYIAK